MCVKWGKEPESKPYPGLQGELDGKQSHHQPLVVFRLALLYGTCTEDLPSSLGKATPSVRLAPRRHQSAERWPQFRVFHGDCRVVVVLYVRGEASHRCSRFPCPPIDGLLRLTAGHGMAFLRRGNLCLHARILTISFTLWLQSTGWPSTTLIPLRTHRRSARVINS